MHLIAIILLSYLLIVLVITLCPALVRPNYSRLQSLKLILFRVLFLDQNRLSLLSTKLALIFLAFNAFLFINFNFLSGNICYSKVVVPTK